MEFTMNDIGYDLILNKAMNAASSTRRPRCAAVERGRRETTRLTSTPSTRARTVAAVAVRRELPSASPTGTASRAPASPTPNSAA